jgi:hypothetical protein
MSALTRSADPRNRDRFPFAFRRADFVRWRAYNKRKPFREDYNVHPQDNLHVVVALAAICAKHASAESATDLKARFEF